MTASQAAASRVALAGLGGCGIGYALGRRAVDTKAPTSLCGCYRLEDDSTFGVIVYTPEGHMCKAVAQRGTRNAPASFTGYCGKWWVHNNKTSFAATYPPHDGSLVEHEMYSSTDESMVGKSEVLRYVLTSQADGDVLSLSQMELMDGESKATCTTRWRRCATGVRAEASSGSFR